MACFFNDGYMDHTFEDTLRHKFSNVQRGLRVLVQRSLISKERFLPMHNLLVQLGREIVRNQSIYEPGKRQFLVDGKETGEVLTSHTGSESVIGINLEVYRIMDELDISERVFEGMPNLQFLRFKGNSYGRLHLPQGLNYLPPKLRILHWDYYPLTSLPSKFNPKYLVKIILKYSKLERLWEGIQPLVNLKLMDLSNSRHLKELPNLSTAINLVEMELCNCSSLMELPSSIGNATNIQSLNLIGCSSLLKIPSSIGNLIALPRLDLTGCSSLVKLPSSIGNVINLQELDLSKCSSLVELPSSIGNLINLPSLDLIGCSSIMELPSSIGNLINLKYFYFHGCSSLLELPSSIGNLISLQKLDLFSCSSLVELPSSIGNLINLRKLDLFMCSSLVKLPSSIGNLINLKKLDLSKCSSLVKLPSSIGNIINLQKLRLSECSSLVELPSSIGNLINLKKLDLSECSSLLELSSSIGNIINLQKLRLSECSSLVELPSSIGNLINLKELDLNKCTKLVSLPQLPHSLSILFAKSCESLETLACSFPNPEVCLKFIDCWKLNEKGRDIIIQTSTSEYTLLPGREVPAFFTYRATTGGSLAVKLNERRLPTSFSFKACILLVRKGDKIDCENWGSVYLTILEKQSGRKYSFESPTLYPLSTEHLYTFEVEAKGVESIELLFEFEINFNEDWEIGECGIRPLLEEDAHVEGSI
ncbi:putative leucine-rich repeat domain superfamily [Arabidopsis thaliana]